MRAGIAILALAAWTILPANARLGETEQESISRYGPVSGSEDENSPGDRDVVLDFHHAGYNIITQFMDGRCELICFQKPDGAALGEDDLDLLLQSEAEGKTWARSKLVSVDLIWDRSDGAQARYDTTHHAFAVCTALYLRAEEMRHHQDKARQLDNL